MTADRLPTDARPTLPPELRREPSAMSDEELAASMRERIDEFNEYWAMARSRSIEVNLSITSSFFGAKPRVTIEVAKKVPL